MFTASVTEAFEAQTLATLNTFASKLGDAKYERGLNKAQLIELLVSHIVPTPDVPSITGTGVVTDVDAWSNDSDDQETVVDQLSDSDFETFLETTA